MKAKQGRATQTIAERKDELKDRENGTYYKLHMKIKCLNLIIDYRYGCDVCARRVYTEQSLHESSVVLISRKPSFLRVLRSKHKRGRYLTYSASIYARCFCEVEDWESGYLDDSVRTVG